MKLLSIAVLCLLAIASSADAQSTAHYGRHGAAVLPDSTATPGAVDAQLTTTELCSPTFHTGTVRDVTDEMKIAACKAYGQNTGCPGSGYEIDHLISIELGGSNDPSNLWPQPIDKPGVIGYKTKDQVEDHAHSAVCAGRLTLAQAQAGIRGDWYAFGLANGLLPSKPKPHPAAASSATPPVTRP